MRIYAVHFTQILLIALYYIMFKHIQESYKQAEKSPDSFEFNSFGGALDDLVFPENFEDLDENAKEVGEIEDKSKSKEKDETSAKNEDKNVNLSNSKNPDLPELNSAKAQNGFYSDSFESTQSSSKTSANPFAKTSTSTKTSTNTTSTKTSTVNSKAITHTSINKAATSASTSKASTPIFKKESKASSSKKLTTLEKTQLEIEREEKKKAKLKVQRMGKKLRRYTKNPVTLNDKVWEMILADKDNGFENVVKELQDNLIPKCFQAQCRTAIEKKQLQSALSMMTQNLEMLSTLGKESKSKSGSGSGEGLKAKTSKDVGDMFDPSQCPMQ